MTIERNGFKNPRNIDDIDCKGNRWMVFPVLLNFGSLIPVAFVVFPLKLPLSYF